MPHLRADLLQQTPPLWGGHSCKMRDKCPRGGGMSAVGIDGADKPHALKTPCWNQTRDQRAQLLGNTVVRSQLFSRDCKDKGQELGVLSCATNATRRSYSTCGSFFFVSKCFGNVTCDQAEF